MPNFSSFPRIGGFDSEAMWLNTGVDAPPPSAAVSTKASGSELFAASTPSANDVAQNGIGDCWLDATMAALAQTAPQAVQGAIVAITTCTGATKTSATGAPLYDVTLQYQGTTEHYQVAASFPVGYKGANLGAATPLDSSNSKAILWPAVLENALGQYLQKHPDVSPLSPSGASVYQSLDYVGNPNWVFKALTGQSPDIANGANIDALLAASTFSNSDQVGGTAAVAGTGLLLSPGQALPLPSGATLTSQSNNVLLYKPAQGPAVALLNHHEYTIENEKAGQVTLRNPWGHGVNTANPDAVVAAQDVSSIFAQVSYSAVSASTASA